jgi:hypothetical protein
MDVEGIGRGIIAGTTPAVSNRDWGKPRNTSVSIADVSAEIRIRYLPNKLRSITVWANVIGETVLHYIGLCCGIWLLTESGTRSSQTPAEQKGPCFYAYYWKGFRADGMSLQMSFLNSLSSERNGMEIPDKKICPKLRFEQVTSEHEATHTSAVRTFGLKC